MKILVVGESPTINSGFANVLRKLNDSFKLAGHDLRQLGWCYHANEENKYPYHIYPVHPGAGPTNYYGVNIFDGIVNDYKPDIVFSLGDVYMVNWIPFMKTRKNFKWVLYTPIDSAPVPNKWYKTLSNADLLITYSKFGLEELKSLPCRYQQEPRMIYHGYDANEFYAFSEEEKLAVKESMGFKDSFIFGYVGTNSTRKQVPRLLEAWSKFKKDHINAKLVLHTSPVDERQGYDLREAIRQFKIDHTTIVFIEGASPIKGVTVEQMNKLYNSFDVFVSAATCEGFGLPFLEAAACGVPSIGVNYSSIPELISGRGELVSPIAYEFHKPLCQRRPFIDTDEFAAKMDLLYNCPELRKDYTQRCLEFAKTMTWEHMLGEFSTALNDVEAMSLSREIAVGSFVEV